MAKHQTVNLILFTAIVALGLVAWLDPFSGPPPIHTPLTNANKAQIQKISLIKAGKEVFRLEKQEMRPDLPWDLTVPLNIPANPLKVNQLLSLTSTNSLRKYQIKSDNLAKLGLAKPAWEIVFELPSKQDNGAQPVAQPKRVVVGFGKTEPIGQKRYVLVEDDVHLINDRVSQFNFGSPLMLANLDILPVDKSVKEVHLPNKVIRRVDGQWVSSSPAEKTVSQTTYKEFIDEWRYAQALRVALADKNEFNLDAQPVTVILEEADQPVHFTIESTGQDFVVTNKDWGVRYYLNSQLGEKLLQLHTPTQE